MRSILTQKSHVNEKMWITFTTRCLCIQYYRRSTFTTSMTGFFGMPFISFHLSFMMRNKAHDVGIESTKFICCMCASVCSMLKFRFDLMRMLCYYDHCYWDVTEHEFTYKLDLAFVYCHRIDAILHKFTVKSRTFDHSINVDSKRWISHGFPFIWMD